MENLRKMERRREYQRVARKKKKSKGLVVEKHHLEKVGGEGPGGNVLY